VKNALMKALAGLDELGDKALQVRVLGIGGEEEKDEGEHPVAEATEKVVADALGEERNEPEADEAIDPALLEKLKSLLAE